MKTLCFFDIDIHEMREGLRAAESGSENTVRFWHRRKRNAGRVHRGRKQVVKTWCVSDIAPREMREGLHAAESGSENIVCF